VSSEQYRDLKGPPVLISFLSEKPLYYKEIDHERVHTAYGMLQSHIRRPQTIHIVGTNGKGSTGRMIAHLAWQYHRPEFPISNSVHRVGHFSSPHILRFNERIWIDGRDASNEMLEAAHQRLFAVLGREMSEALSYFEYTTLLAFVVFEHCDLMVLEAGLGGEFDATNVCDKELSVITPIGVDHQAFLGETIEEIAGTKIRSIQKKALLAPQPHPEVLEVAQKIAEDVGATLVVAHPTQDIVQIKDWPEYLVENASVALQALDILEIPYSVDDLKCLELFGRYYPLTERIRIDVGHNPLAAKAIEKALDRQVVLIYNSLDDKDYEEVLRLLKPKVKRVEIIEIDAQRATTIEAIEKALERIKLPYSRYKNALDKQEYYLVFGSFYVVEKFLKSTRDI
jgi:dihydrofolate synthase/folylpolyglutamate synthase